MDSQESIKVHSLLINNYNTYDMWSLIPSQRPRISPPEPDITKIEVPGRYGDIDITKLANLRPNYKNCVGSIEFIVSDRTRNWLSVYSDIKNKIHGMFATVILLDDPGYYYEGRVSVKDWDSGAQWSTITIHYDLYPFKKEMTSSLEDWLWDPFDFESGVIRDYRNIAPGNFHIDGSSEYVVPVIKLHKNDYMSKPTVTYKGRTYSLNEGDNIIPQIEIGPSGEDLYFSIDSADTLSIEYKAGWL